MRPDGETKSRREASGAHGIVGPATVAIAVIVAVAGCKWRTSSPSGERGAEETDSAEAEPDTDRDESVDREAPDREKWTERVRQKLAEADDQPRVEPEDSGECTLFPDNCGEGKSCFVGPAGERKCAAFNPGKSVGDPCHEGDRCNLGQQCVGDGPATCLETCSPNDLERRGCPSGHVCTPIVGAGGEEFDWGVCRRVEDRCRPWPDDSCAIGEACVRTPAGLRCQPYRPGTESGEACVDPSDCRLGQVCVAAVEGLGACRRRCDEDHPCSDTECRAIRGRDFGFCPGAE